MVKIIACSDNHGNLEPIFDILNNNQNADFYLHMGDCCMDSNKIRPFCSVMGNNDYDDKLPDYRIIQVDDNNKIYMTHGHYFSFNKSRMIEEAKKNNCNIILCGHTHCFQDKEIDGVRVINPGSCYYNRDRSEPCYAIITIDKGIIKVEKKELSVYY